MGNRCIKPRKKVTLVMVGLDNAGKTTATKNIVGESPEDVAPTLGFSSFQLSKHNYHVTIYDLGGSLSIRGIWRNYFAEAFGFIFVVDASDMQRIVECRNVLHGLFKNPTVPGKPFLILANKQDVEGALDDVELIANLELESVVNKSRSRTRVETCSALSIGKRKMGKNIYAGFKWLLVTIGLDYENLKERIDQDIAVQQQIQAKEKLEREERVRKLREERANGANESNQTELEICENDGFENSNPFKPISTIAKELEEKVKSPSETVQAIFQDELKPAESVTGVVGELFKVPAEDKQSSHDNNKLVTENATQPPGVVEETSSPYASKQSLADNTLVVSHLRFPSEAGSDDDIIEVEEKKKSHKRKLFARNNKTAPLPDDGLPPLIVRTGQWIPTSPNGSPELCARPNSEMKHSWGLAEELQITDNSSSPLKT